MRTIDAIASAWNWHVPAIVFCVALLSFYVSVTRVQSRVQTGRAFLWFFCGVLLLAVVLCSPLDLLARDYLLTAEAIERILLALTIPYLLMRGFTARIAPFRIPYAIAWIAGMAVLSIWFLPRLLNAALASETVRRVEIATVLFGGLIFWWPLHSPVRTQRIPMVPNALLYLTAATVWCSILGLFLAFEQPWYFSRYSNPLDVLHIAGSLTQDWSFTRENDQQTAGLLFWIGAGTVLLSEVMFTYYRWYVAQSTRPDTRRKSRV